MGRFARRLWRSGVAGIDIPRRDRSGGLYQAYLPDMLAGRSFSLDGDVAADIDDAAIALARLDSTAIALTTTEPLARLLLRAESVASSHIEGLVLSPQRILRAASDRDEGLYVADQTANDVLANIDAMEFAVLGDGDITRERILEVHRRLLSSGRAAQFAGVFRTEQNWIGGSDYNPIGAAFVPPPPDDLPGLIDDLLAFCNDDALSPVAQAALAHAQFETIHPFADGNGRAGRALIPMILRRRGLARRAFAPISLVLATRSKEYIARLSATRYSGAPSSKIARDAINAWLAFFAAACTASVAEAEVFERRVAALQNEWRKRVSEKRSDSTVFDLITWLPAAPILSTTIAARLTGRSFAAANNALSELAEAGVVVASRTSRRNRTFEARELIDAFTNLERRLSSPARDTKVAKPARPVPARPRR